ncbi:MAG: hypothetical protein K2Q12_08320 [Rickettsiales bacterium]|nr:hypothetical protein [Rickettsiales bacterium]
MTRATRLLGRRNSPSRISGLRVWLDAADISTLTFNSSTIAQWRDKSGFNNHASQATALRQPRYNATALSGLPAIEGRHDGTNASQLTISDSPSLDYSQFTQFLVLQRVTDLNFNEHLVGKFLISGSQIEQRMVIQGASDRVYLSADLDGASGGEVNPVLTTPTLAVGTRYVLDSQYAGTTLRLRANNSTAITGTLASIFNGTAPFVLFSQGTSFSEPYAGHIAEFLFYNRALSTSERQTVMHYLSTKWRVTLS